MKRSGALFKAQSGGFELNPLSFTGGKGQYGSHHSFNHGVTVGHVAQQTPYGDYRLGAINRDDPRKIHSSSKVRAVSEQGHGLIHRGLSSATQRWGPASWTEMNSSLITLHNMLCRVFTSFDNRADMLLGGKLLCLTLSHTKKLKPINHPFRGGHQ